MKRREALLAAAACAAGAFVLLADCLLPPGALLPSLPMTDMGAHALPTLTFLARCLRAGDLPLWNPHSFSGQPFLGDFEPAALYPVNWAAAALGPAALIALSCWLHAALAALGAYILCRRRKATPAAAACGAAAFALCAPVVLLLAPGHVGPFAVTAWAPWLLLSLEAWLERRDARWLLAAAAFSALQWLAGYPQMAYLSALACAASASLGAARAAKPGAAVLGAAAALAGGAALAAAQLLPGLEAAAESVRGSGLSADAAARFAMPPENVVTLLAPWTLGGFGELPYFGRGYLWEHSLFFGRVALALAFVGLAADKGGRRLAVVAAAAFLFSLGPATPLYAAARAVLPGFSALRGAAKALFLVPLFLAPLVARGFDAAREEPAARRLGWTAGALAGLCAALLVALSVSPSGFARALAALGESGAAETGGGMHRSPEFTQAAANWAARELAAALGVLAALAAAAFGASRKARPALLCAALLAELGAFAWASRESSAPAALYPGTWLEAAAKLAPGERVLHDPFAFPNASLTTGALDAWGYAALVPGRYARLMAGTQGIAPENAQNLFPFTREHPALDLARLRLVLDPRPGLRIRSRPGVLPEARAYGAWRLFSADGALAAVLDPKRPAAAVVEAAPPFPSSSRPPKGRVSVARRGPDGLDAQVELDAPAVVALPESYSRGWRARDGAGKPVPLFPVDYAFLGFSVPAGPTSVRLEYAPASWRLGLTLSLLSLILWTTLLIARRR